MQIILLLLMIALPFILIVFVLNKFKIFDLNQLLAQGWLLWIGWIILMFILSMFLSGNNKIFKILIVFYLSVVTNSIILRSIKYYLSEVNYPTEIWKISFWLSLTTTTVWLGMILFFSIIDEYLDSEDYEIKCGA